MINVKDISVKVTYTVTLGDVEMTEEEYAQLLEACENMEEIDGTGIKYPEAVSWISAEIRERDAHEWSYEVNEIEKSE